MRKITPLLLILGILALAFAQTAPDFTGLTVELDQGLGVEIYDTMTVCSLMVDTFPQALWFVEVGIVDTTETDTFYCYPNASGTTLSYGAASGTAWPVRLYGPTQPNKYHIPQKYNWGPLVMESITMWGWVASMGSGANPDDSTVLIYRRGYTVPIGYNPD